MKIKDESFSEKKGYSSYSSYTSDDGCIWKKGVYVSPNGIVRVYAEPKCGRRKESIISLSFSINGRVYYRTITGNKTISDRALSVRASQFVKHVINNE